MRAHYVLREPSRREGVPGMLWEGQRWWWEQSLCPQEGERGKQTNKTAFLEDQGQPPSCHEEKVRPRFSGLLYRKNCEKHTLKPKIVLIICFSLLFPLNDTLTEQGSNLYLKDDIIKTPKVQSDQLTSLGFLILNDRKYTWENKIPKGAHLMMSLT